MGLFENFPYANSHELNLDWILHELKELETEITNFVEINAVKYANPIIWDITSQYETNTVVLDNSGNAYLSVQPVPAGVSLDRTEYWTQIGNFSALCDSVRSAITPYDEQHNTTASVDHKAGDWVWLENDLLLITKDMTAGDKYITGSNCETVSVMQLFNNLQNGVNTSIVSIGKQIAQETADRQAADENIINTLNKTLVIRKYDEFGAIGDGVTDDSDALISMFSNPGLYYLGNEKTFKISKTIPISSNCTIFGNSTIKLANATQLLSPLTIGNGGMFSFVNAENLEIFGITFDANMQNQALPTAREPYYNIMMFCVSSKNINIHDCNFINLYSFSVYMHYCTGILNVNGNTMKSPVQNQGYYADHIVVQSCSNGTLKIDGNMIDNEDYTTSDTGVCGVTIANTRTVDITITNNKMVNVGRREGPPYLHRLYPIDFYNDVHNALVANNTIKSHFGFMRLENCYNCKIDGNNLTIDQLPDTHGDAVIWIGNGPYTGEGLDDCGFITVSNNKFQTTGTLYIGILLHNPSKNSGYKFHDVNITGNMYTSKDESGHSSFIGTDCRVSNLLVDGNIVNVPANFIYTLATQSDLTIAESCWKICNNIIIAGGRLFTNSISFTTPPVTDIRFENNTLKSKTFDCYQVKDIPTAICGNDISGNLIATGAEKSYAYNNIIRKTDGYISDGFIHFNNIRGDKIIDPPTQA